MARAQRPKLRNAPLPVIVPPMRGPKFIDAEYTAKGFSFTMPTGRFRETYRLMKYSWGAPVLERQDTPV